VDRHFVGGLDRVMVGVGDRHLHGALLLQQAKLRVDLFPRV
jgi:hypothetical protein